MKASEDSDQVKPGFAEDGPTQSAANPEATNGKILRSWKEIAAHLGVTVRTAQRWERELELPIHRPAADGKVRPFAFTNELEQWLRQRDPSRLAPTPARRRSRLVWLIPLGSISLLTAAWIAIHLSPNPGEPKTADFNQNTLTVYDEEGRICWHHSFPELKPDPDWGWDAEQYDTTLIDDLNEDGNPEILLNLLPSQGDESRGRLVCYDSNGDLMWEFPYGKSFEHGGRRFSDKYWGRFVRHIRGARDHYVLTVAVHYRWYPAQVALLNPRTGELIEEYWHPGAFYRMLSKDLDADGVSEILLAGINNPGPGLGHACLLALKVPFSLQSPSKERGFWERSEIGEFRYTLFPQSDIATVLGQLPIVQDLEPVGEDLQISLRFMENGRLYYRLNASFDVVDFRFSDNLLSTHSRFYRERTIGHELGPDELECLATTISFASAPDGNSPALADYWTRCEEPLTVETMQPGR